MKKWWLLFAALAVCLLFGGCTDAQIRCGVNRGCQAYLEVDLQVALEPNGAENPQIISMIYDLTDYYEKELGYQVTLDLQKEEAKVSMSLVRQADSYPEAFEELEKMLTDERLTPFTTLSMSQTGDGMEQGYRLKGTINGEQFLQEAQWQSLPKQAREFVTQGLAGSSAVLEITLPGSEVIESQGSTAQDGAFITSEIPISFDQPTQAQLSTRANFVNGKPAAAAAQESMRRLNLLEGIFKTGIAVFAGGFCLCVILMILFAVKRKKNL